jgi:cis-3-alkyl-4-acyloxetan-2-one decarboxylase
MTFMLKKASIASGAWRDLYPFVSRWMELSSGRMQYLDEGPLVSTEADRGTLLFIHGNPTWSFHWRLLIAGLRSEYRCIAPDHIGCGLSTKPMLYLALQDHIKNLVTFINGLSLGHVTLVAQDWGGAIGLGAMLQMPERLKRIILFNTGAFPPRYIPWRIRACRIPFIGKLAVQGANLFSRSALRMTLARRKRLDPAVEAGYLAPYDSWSNRRAVYGFVRDIPDSPTHKTWGVLAEIERQLPAFSGLPVALIWGMRDWCFRPDCLERFIEVWPQAEAHRLADVGHWVVEDAPDESLRIVANYLARTETATCEPQGLSRRN